MNENCKIIFSVSKVQQFVCQNDGDCLITYKYRRSCNCCRLAKCFRVGMKKSLILSDEEREARNKLVQENRLKRGKVTKRLCDDWVCIKNHSVKFILIRNRVNLNRDQFG